MGKQIKIEVESYSLTLPITKEVLDRSIDILNEVFNTEEFKIELSKQSFFCSNKPSMCSENREITGESVYNDFITKGQIKINFTVKNLVNPWKRFISNTYGETDPKGNSIVSYTWWLNRKNGKELMLAYATHIGHEIFHTKYLAYIHDPEYRSREFINEKDVTYMIDDILEKLISKKINT
jgi:hypothetical protein